MVQDWRSLVAQKRAEVAKQLPQEWRLPTEIMSTISETANVSVLDVPAKCGILSAKEIDITENHDAVDLVEKMAKKELTSSEVTLAFCKRAAIAHQLTNCLTEMFFGQAQERAKFLDEYLEKEGKPMGPLHGMPVSLKDSFNVKGVSSTIGYVSFINKKPADFNSPLVEILLKAGAVLYVKTNIPQTLMTADSENNVFGRTLNPCNLSLTAGGSSGGEGALVGIRGSILGVGTDIAGSIRIPALCCGAYGFKPSTDRIPQGGQANPSRDGWAGIIPLAGPLAQSPRDLRLFLETVIKSKPWDFDASARAKPWDSVSTKSSLTIGLIYECPSWPVSPPVLRSIQTAAKKLESAGHKVIPIAKFPSYSEVTELAFGFFDIDNAETGHKFIVDSGEPVVKSVADMYSPPPGGRPTRTLDNFLDMTASRSEIQETWHKIFIENDLDVVIAPGAQKTAVPHDTFKLPPYTTYWNLLDYPACVIPYLRADKSIDVARAEYQEDYDASAVDGAPCSIQVVARPEHDEELIAAVEIIARGLGV
ncbi:hypothetical protein LTR84_003706 [Exophiala bonariae]|uniref:amidase n=1 Tax=Exophiala bonariae TaxID=1690606 RepID=A0AAV9N605_9EURO|nr:hypothetical protein LTR84_003706 [Exophiala bonariae]